MRNRSRATIAVTLLLVLSACSGPPGTSAPSEPAETEDVATDEPTPVATDSASETPEASAEETFDSGNGRPATISFQLSGTTTDVDGVYTGSGPARLCGNAVMNLTGNTKSFSLEFPDLLPQGQIKDLTFGADDLVPNSSTTVFYISVGVKAADGHEPPSIVFDTEDGGDANGSAQRSESGDTTTVTVEAVDDLGQTISLTATCGPRPG
jgi:hypothetical protein